MHLEPKSTNSGRFSCKTFSFALLKISDTMFLNINFFQIIIVAELWNASDLFGYLKITHSIIFSQMSSSTDKNDNEINM